MNDSKMGLEWSKKIFNSIKAGMVIIDQEKRSIIDVNDQALIMMGCDREKLVGHPCEELFCNKRTGNCPVLDQGMCLEDYETSIDRADGSRLIILKTINTILCDNKKYLVESFVDITGLRDNEERVKSLLKLSEGHFENEEAVARFALDEAVKLTNSKVGYLHFVKKNNVDEMALDLFVWSTNTTAQCTAEKTPHYPLHEAGIWADCVRTHAPVVHNDYPNEPSKKGYPEGHFQIKRHMSVPVINGNDSIVAIMGVGNKEDPYTDFDVNQLQLFANSMWTIIKRKRAEMDLSISEKKYKHIVESAPAAIYEIDFNEMKIITADGNIDRLSGYSKEELLNINPVELVDPADHSKLADRVKRVLEGKIVPNEIEYKLRTKGGGLRNVLVQASYRKREEDGHMIAYVLASDITELRNAEFRANAYFNLAPVIFIALDQHANILLLNNFGKELLKCDDDIIGKNWFDEFIHNDDKANVRKFLDYLNDGTHDSSLTENNVLTKDGNTRIISWRNIVLRNIDGSAHTILSAGEDVTEDRAREKELAHYWAEEGRRLEHNLNKLSLLSHAAEA